jgi:hypothetical protein
MLNRLRSLVLLSHRANSFGLAAALAGLPACAMAADCDRYAGDVAALYVRIPLNVAPPNGKEFFSNAPPSLVEDENHHYPSERYDIEKTNLFVFFCAPRLVERNGLRIKVGPSVSAAIVEDYDKQYASSYRVVNLRVTNTVQLNWGTPSSVKWVRATDKLNQHIVVQLKAPSGIKIFAHSVSLTLFKSSSSCRVLGAPSEESRYKSQIAMSVNGGKDRLVSAYFIPGAPCGPQDRLEVQLGQVDFNSTKSPALTIHFKPQAIFERTDFLALLTACKSGAVGRPSAGCPWYSFRHPADPIDPVTGHIDTDMGQIDTSTGMLWFEQTDSVSFSFEGTNVFPHEFFGRRVK